jgi:hypothetical protein
MDATLLEIVKMLVTALVAITGMVGGQAVYNRWKGTTVLASDENNMVEKTNILSQTVAEMREDLKDIKIAIQTLVRIEERLNSMSSVVKLEVTEAIIEHEHTFHKSKEVLK